MTETVQDLISNGAAVLYVCEQILSGLLATFVVRVGRLTVDLPEMFPNYPCRRLEHKRAPFAAPEDVHYSIQQSYQPEIASGEIAMPIC